jgi:hypothetical protein
LIFNDLKGICEEKKVPHSNKTTEEDSKPEEEAESKKEALVLKMKSSNSPCRKPVIPTTDKEPEIWEDKDQKAYAIISAT